MRQSYTFLILLLLTLVACKKDPPEKKPDPLPSTGGMFISSEGLFPTGAGVLSFFDPATSTVSNGIFAAANNRPLGNILQSVVFDTDRGYLPVNNGERLEIVDRSTMNSIHTLTGLIQPRYALPLDNGKLYISQWGAGGTQGSVEVYNSTNFQLIKSIPSGSGTGRMLRYGNHLWVVNEGGFAQDSAVQVIDHSQDTIVTTLQFPTNPNSLQLDKQNQLWILTGGIFDWSNPANDTEGHLLKLDPEDFSVQLDLVFPNKNGHPADLQIDGTGSFLYYRYNNKVYRQSVDAQVLELNEVVNRRFYGIGLDPDRNELYGADDNGFSSESTVLRYNLDNGQVIDSFTTAVGSGYFYYLP